jgi:enoyl-CoA hydratase
MAESLVTYELEESVASLRVDDGKANAISLPLIAAVDQALDRAEAEAQCVLIAGRPGYFSAGFDLGVMRQGADAARTLVTKGAELALRLYAFPTPVVMACTGHALAMGAILLTVGDTCMGAEGEFKIGLNEVAIGMPLPDFGIEFSRERLSPPHLARAVINSEIFSPAGAVAAGFLDRVVAPEVLNAEARAEAQRLSQLNRMAYHHTKLRMRGEAIDRIRRSL